MPWSRLPMGEYRRVEVMGPLQSQRITAKYGIINGRTAVMEMAEASGLTLLKKVERDPLKTTTYGTGQMIKAALDEGIRDIIIGIGGSATNDGGIGACQALGIRFLDEEGREVGFGGQELSRIKEILVEDLDDRIKECTITVICDVNNPLVGPNGATAVYGPQKGVTDDSFPILESGMENYQTLIKGSNGTGYGSGTGKRCCRRIGGCTGGLPWRDSEARNPGYPGLCGF